MKASFTLSFATVAALAASAVHADEWGTIKGKFVFGGAAPTVVELKADKDVEVCGKHKLLAEELVVSADKGVANVVVFVRDKGVKVHPDLATPGDKVVLDNKDCRFDPHVAVVRTGQTLVIKNSDTVGHNSNVATIKNSPSNNLIPAGGEATVTFASEEAIPAGHLQHPSVDEVVARRPPEPLRHRIEGRRVVRNQECSRRRRDRTADLAREGGLCRRSHRGWQGREDRQGS